MTNYEALYNQAMAHVAMLREALGEYCKKKIKTPFHSYDDFKRGDVACAESVLDLLETLNATGPDVDAWLKKRDDDAVTAFATNSGLYDLLGYTETALEKLEQLTTVTAERNALLEGIRQAYDLAICEGMGGCVPYLCKLLAQKGGE